MQIGVESARAVDNKRIFVVEGDEIIRAALQFMLHDENETHEITTLAGAYAKAESRKPDLILLGLGLVAEHGLRALKEIRTRIPGVKLAVVAGSPADPMAMDCLKEGAHALLTQPFRIETVRRKVDILLGRRAQVGVKVEVA